MYSAYKLNKQGDNIQPWRTPFPIWNQSVVPCPLVTVASWPAYKFLKRQIRWSGIPISFRIYQFIMIHTVKGFVIVNKAEIDVFLELSCFFHDPADVGNLISGFSAFSMSTPIAWFVFFSIKDQCLRVFKQPPISHEGVSVKIIWVTYNMLNSYGFLLLMTTVLLLSQMCLFHSLFLVEMHSQEAFKFLMQTTFESIWANLLFFFSRYVQILVLDLVGLQGGLYPSINMCLDKLFSSFVSLISHL